MKKVLVNGSKRTHKNGNNADLQTNIDRRIEFNKLAGVLGAREG